ncbi:MAG: DUF2752 domain-containing protein [Chitinophagales bacterium]
MQKKWLYTLVAVCSLAGSLWVLWNIQNNTLTNTHAGPDVCLFRKVTGLPCPSCGSTRSVLYITKLEFRDALYANPIGFLLAAGILIFPFWILYDITTRKKTFYNFYHTLETSIRKRWVTVALICLFTANWLWNIYKFT